MKKGFFLLLKKEKRMLANLFKQCSLFWNTNIFGVHKMHVQGHRKVLILSGVGDDNLDISFVLNMNDRSERLEFPLSSYIPSPLQLEVRAVICSPRMP